MTIRKTVAIMQAREGFSPKLPGGVRQHPRRFDSDALIVGAKHELEHTSDPEIAVEVAMGHLIEDRNYYAKRTCSAAPTLVRGRLVR